MKRIFLVGTFLFLCVSAIAVFAENSDDKSVVAEKYLKVIGSPDSLSVVLIDPWVEDATDWMDGYGEILSTSIVKDVKVVEEVSKLLSDPKSFEIHELVKDCTHMPDAVLIFHSKKGDVRVSYSSYCDIFRFAQGEDYEELEGEHIRLQFLEFLKRVYPKDRYIRTLIKREKSNFK